MNFLSLNKMINPVQNQKGSLLILVLFALMTLSLLAFSVGHTIQQKFLVASRLDSRENLRLAAEAAAKQVSQFLSEKGSGASYHALNQMWAQNEGLWKKASLGSIEYSILASTEGSSSAAYGLMDEDRKINVHSANATALQNLFVFAAGVEPESARRIVASIQDWRDEDEDFRDGGAESKTYLNRQSPYRAKNGLFNDLQELFWVEGITPEIFKKIKPYLTLDASLVNINTASQIVLKAMGMNDTIASKILTFREGQDQKIGTADDGVFTSLSEVPDKLERYIYLNEADRAALGSLLGSGFSVSSTCFFANIEAHLRYQNRRMVAHVVFNSDGVIQKWHEEFF